MTVGSVIWARLDDANTVVELITVAPGGDINALYTPALVASMVKTDGTVQIGYTWNGSIFSVPVVPPPTPDQQLDAKLTAGIQITSSTSGLAGTYAITDGAVQDITGIVALIAAGGSLPANPLPWADLSGTPHNFTAPQITALAVAMSSYIFGLRQSWGSLKQGGPANWPSQPISI